MKDQLEKALKGTKLLKEAQELKTKKPKKDKSKTKIIEGEEEITKEMEELWKSKNSY